MEWTISLMPPDVYQFVWICDLYDFGLNDCRPSIGKLVPQASSRACGKCSGCFWTPARRRRCFSRKRMYRRGCEGSPGPCGQQVTFVNGPTNASRRRRLLEVLRKEASFDERMAEWAVTEMEQNRDREVSATKSWLGLSLRNEQRKYAAHPSEPSDPQVPPTPSHAPSVIRCSMLQRHSAGATRTLGSAQLAANGEARPDLCAAPTRCCQQGRP
eukprot:scaffold1481_cov401-Prasinococcus_capsulatus_cf.AAC.9